MSDPVKKSSSGRPIAENVAAIKETIEGRFVYAEDMHGVWSPAQCKVDPGVVGEPTLQFPEGDRLPWPRNKIWLPEQPFNKLTRERTACTAQRAFERREETLIRQKDQEMMAELRSEVRSVNKAIRERKAAKS